MKGLSVIHRNPPASLARMAGLSLVELMIAMALGLMVLAGLATLFANQSAARAEMERSSRQIENGRFAIELLSDELRVAGFYGELSVNAFAPPAALADPCSFNPADWVAAIPHHIQGYDNGVGAPGCIPGTLKANTDVLVVRRVSTCEADTANCAVSASGKPYIQVARCNTQLIALPISPAPDNAYELGLKGTAPFTRTVRNCTGAAGLREYIVRIYYIQVDPVLPVPVLPELPQFVPVLKRLDFNATTNAWVVTPLVEGIEEFQIEYGIDTNDDGDPDVYNANPTTYAGTAVSNWARTVTARVHLIARNIESSARYTDPKTYTLGRDAAGVVVSRPPPHPANGVNGYRRHAYSQLIRLVNPSDRRDIP